MRILIFDRRGRALTEVDAPAEVVWALYEPGEMTFDIATRDEKCREEYLQFGNLVHVIFERLPAWTGVVARRTWNYGRLTVEVRGAEELLRYRVTPMKKISGSAGRIFEQLLDIYNEGADAIIRPGEIYKDGNSREETLGDSVYVHAARVRERSGQIFSIRGEIGANGDLELWGDWRPMPDEIGGYLAEGKHLALKEPMMAEETPIWNRVIGLGDATTSGSRLSVFLEDAESIGKYGLRSTNVVFQGNTTLETLERNTREYLARWSRPAVRVACALVDEGDNFARMRPGKKYVLELYSAGFYAGGIGARIVGRAMAMRYDGESLDVGMEVEDGSV